MEKRHRRHQGFKALLAASGRASRLRRWRPRVDQFRHALACCFVRLAADAAADVVEHVLGVARPRTGDSASTSRTKSQPLMSAQDPEKVQLESYRLDSQRALSRQGSSHGGF